MNKTLRYIILAIATVGCMLPSAASEIADSLQRAPIVRKKILPANPAEAQELVRVGSDTVSIVIPQRNYGRFDRGLFNFLYIPKGEWALGFTASYGEINTEDMQIFSIIDDVNFNGKIYSLKPTVSYFFDHNQAIGVRLNYTKGSANINSLVMDIDDDLNLDIHNVGYSSQSYTMGLFYRYYVGLDKKGRFSVFNEVSLDFGSGSSRFKRYYSDELFDTRTTSTMANLNFSPGVCVFLQQQVAFNVSFGVFGLKLAKEKQKTNGVDDGSRFSSGANFKFNIFNISFGMMVVI